MEKHVKLFLILLTVVLTSSAQERVPHRLLQAYWDDDYINFYGKGTDKSYTNGTRISLFYIKKKPSDFLIDRFLPKAGDSSENVFGVGLSQLMFTPNDITKSNFQSDDYPWSGTLFITYNLYSYNEKKKYDFQTELDFGFTGPVSLARQTQTMIHEIVNYEEPKGWNNQLRNSLIVNLNFTAEQQLFQHRKFFEVIGGGQLMVGTGTNGGALYSLIRIGKMNPYFQGLIKHYSGSEERSKVQFYFVFKSKVQLVLSNASLQGVTLEGNRYRPIKNTVANYSFGAVLVIDRFSISSTQTTSTAWMEGLYGHTWGNFTLTYFF
jgi:lipid A 3-O-deacylase